MAPTVETKELQEPECVPEREEFNEGEPDISRLERALLAAMPSPARAKRPPPPRRAESLYQQLVPHRVSPAWGAQELATMLRRDGGQAGRCVQAPLAITDKDHASAAPTRIEPPEVVRARERALRARQRALQVVAASARAERPAPAARRRIVAKSKAPPGFAPAAAAPADGTGTEDERGTPARKVAEEENGSEKKQQATPDAARPADAPSVTLPEEPTSPKEEEGGGKVSQKRKLSGEGALTTPRAKSSKQGKGGASASMGKQVEDAVREVVAEGKTAAKRVRIARVK